VITIVSHDAGGAEVLSSYVKQNSLPAFFCLEGPAKKIFQRKLGAVESIGLEEAILQSAKVICGTGWQSDYEWNAIKLARQNGIQSIAFLDHWINYQQRFVRHGELLLPDEIWVGDSDAQEIARKTFLNTKICLVENPYIRDVIRDFKSLSGKHEGHQGKSSEFDILYICEPIINPEKCSYTDKEAVHYFLNNIDVLSIDKPRISILVRPHPSEKHGKYDWIQERFPKLKIELSFGRELLEEIAMSEMVVGRNSMALVVALAVGKPTISCIPPYGSPCCLPQTGIIDFQSLL
jgi:hypothetical protein